MDKVSCFFIGTIFGAFLMAVLLSTLSDEPKAMDVYQGKTTLKYTIVDGIKTDSVVIYKQK